MMPVMIIANRMYLANNQSSDLKLTRLYPLKFALSAMAPDTMVAQVAAKVH